MTYNEKFNRRYSDGSEQWIISPAQPCHNGEDHDFAPENGAMFGENGNCCAVCGAFSGVEYRNITE